ncbi:MAG TPA: alpha/beta hydrolase [Vicinamibacterales bacterium]|nr:alpha/beta hydrolase [Vicinamibacterales bacterium]
MALTTSAAAPAAAQTTPTTSNSRFTILLRGARIGAENITVSRSAAGWQISAASQIDPPLDLVVTKFEMSYGLDWQPRQLSIEGRLRGQSLMLTTSFGLTSATSEITQAGQRGVATHQIASRSVVLPTNFFAAYEALASRLAETPAGGSLPIYVAPDGQSTATVVRVTPRRIVTPEATVDIREYDLTFNNPGNPIGVQVWVDEANRLARVVVPSASLAALRDDLSSVLMREEKIRNAGDEDVFIPVSGFNLGATITRPVTPVERAPAVILVAGSGPQDRDHSQYGVSIFGQIAGALSEAGYFVVRYDQRGVGQSGGRVENATIAEYAADVVGIVSWLRKRRDVDADRLAVIGYGEGGAVALTAADREKRFKSVVLIASPGTSGREATLAQQAQLLAQIDAPEADKQARIVLQRQLVDAVITGKGWEGVPPGIRRQADTAWFKSWLLFNPETAIPKVKQPILILHGGLDQEVPPANGERLEQIARARKGLPETATRRVVVADANHLLVPAKQGSVSEYALLPSFTIAPSVGATLVDWLNDTLTRR